MDTFVMNFSSETQENLAYQINDYASKKNLLIKQVSVNLSSGYAYAFVVFEKKQ